MARFGLCSAKGSPGVTTLCCLLAGSWPSSRRCVLVEADRQGGDLAAWFGLSPERGVAGFMAAIRQGTLPGARAVGKLLPEQLQAEVAELPGGIEAVAGFVGSWPRDHQELYDTYQACLGWFEAPHVDLLVDLGRLDPRDVGEATNGFDVIAVVTRLGVGDLAHCMDLLHKIQKAGSEEQMLCVIPVGGPSEIIGELKKIVPAVVTEAVPMDEVAAGVVSGRRQASRRLQRSLLLSAGEHLAHRLSALVQEREFEGPSLQEALVSGGDK
jgi:hypothetical protein